MKFQRIKPIIAFLTILFTSACGGESPAEKSKITSDNASISVLDAYMQVKDALVKTDYNVAHTAADALKKAMQSESHVVSEQLTADLVALVNAADMNDIRRAFYPLSQKIKSYLKETVKGQTLYEQYCPMAFDNTGATWLSVDEQIQNPYFGSLMLTCGSVRDTLRL